MKEAGKYWDDPEIETYTLMKCLIGVKRRMRKVDCNTEIGRAEAHDLIDDCFDIAEVLDRRVFCGK